MHPSLHLHLFFFFLFFISPSTSIPISLTDHFTLPSSSSISSSSSAQEYIDPTYPAPLLPSSSPNCSHFLFHHSFSNTYGSPPFTTSYSPPPSCPPPWSRLVLDLSFASAGDQYDRIAAVWFDGVELLRTSTAEPNDAGVFWRVRKDVTRFSSIFRRPEGGNISMMLENIVNDVYTGVYHVNASLDFYSEEEIEPDLAYGVGEEKAQPLYLEPADLIVPISEENGEDGFWFRIRNESDVRFTNVSIPSNTYRAVLEIFVSFHSNDEFWYTNPPDSYLEKNNLTTKRGNGFFRQVFATVDGKVAGSVVPFPVIFTGGINPLFWAPVVGLGAFDLPSYNLELTPFLGTLLDGNNSHDLGLGVTDGIEFWLVDANLHLWLDENSDSVTAELVDYHVPNISISRRYDFHLLNGTFKIEAGRKSHISGWVNSSLGNLTTDVDQKLKFKSSIEYTDDGNYKAVHMKAKSKIDVRIRSGPKTLYAQETFKTKYPLAIITSTLQGENDTYTSRTNLSHTLYEESSRTVGKDVTTVAVTDRQDASGWMLVEDHSVLSGSAGTQQIYQFRDKNGIYKRIVRARDGVLLSDNTTASTAGFASM
ncbi:peptide-N4-(N-acetyl-beta-glucosaminyl)asparagine amidase A-like [Typha angustifolia]|uniref:peptide-N4-(N-acetyl-beta- glucosaminyl)asparagine amidase A-like n=1 Tax=Typha angustifolia TaxID=59011 RepID=UPI003C2F8B12